jgi:hypothetical protein
MIRVVKTAHQEYWAKRVAALQEHGIQSESDTRFLEHARTAYWSTFDPQLGNIPSNRPLSFSVERGFATAINFLYRTLGAIPEIWDRKMQGVELSAEHLRQIAKSASVLARSLMGTNIVVFNELENHLKKPGASYGFQSEGFCLTEQGGRFSLSISPDLIQDLRVDSVDYEDMVTTGCPARDCREAFQGAFEWMHEVRDELYLPYLSSLKQEKGFH